MAGIQNQSLYIGMIPSNPCSHILTNIAVNTKLSCCSLYILHSSLITAQRCYWYVFSVLTLYFIYVFLFVRFKPHLFTNSRHSSNIVLLFSPFTFLLNTVCPHLQNLSQYSGLSINLMECPPSSNSSYNLGSSKPFSGRSQDNSLKI